MDQLYVFLLGAGATSSAAIAVFFVRFWGRTRDRFFMAFAVAFALMAANWTVIALSSHGNEAHWSIYLLRLAAFACIIWAIVDKNRAARKAE
jgi:hypothetical protein